jgi:uncharacterized iron-regulated membrane protein
MKKAKAVIVCLCLGAILLGATACVVRSNRRPPPRRPAPRRPIRRRPPRHHFSFSYQQQQYIIEEKTDR